MTVRYASVQELLAWLRAPQDDLEVTQTLLASAAYTLPGQNPGQAPAPAPAPTPAPAGPAAASPGKDPAATPKRSVRINFRAP